MNYVCATRESDPTRKYELFLRGLAHRTANEFHDDKRNCILNLWNINSNTYRSLKCMRSRSGYCEDRECVTEGDILYY